MLFSTRHALACVFLILSAAASSQSQTSPEKTATSSISGKVTLKSKGLPGTVVVAREPNSGPRDKNEHRATTDEAGNYRITNLSAGTYMVSPIALSAVLVTESNGNKVIIREGEDLEDVDFALMRGGVITGRVTDADGRPMIEEYVGVMLVENTTGNSVFSGAEVRTDDRGIYRAFGLRPGKYNVYVGQEDRLPGTRPAYRQTFYPSVTDFSKATAIEVTEGSEATNIDITLGRPITGFRVTGRIVDGGTGKPLANVRYGVSRFSDHGASTTTGDTTDALGKFQMENVSPGKYAVFIVPGGSDGFRADYVSFEVVDSDVNDLLITSSKGASVSGVVVMESGEPITALTKSGEFYLNAWVENSDLHRGGGPVAVKPDGSFTINGLRKGLVHFGFASWKPRTRNIELVRVERDGVSQPRGMILKDGEQVSGLRLVVKYLTGAIHGQVKVEGDDLLPGMRMSVWISRVDDQRATGASPELDSRRSFMVEGLAAGTYEVNVAVFDPNRSDTTGLYKQQVTVADNMTSEVTVTVKGRP